MFALPSLQQLAFFNFLSFCVHHASPVPGFTSAYFNTLPTMDGDVLAQFTEITGSSPELATQYLQLTDFNIEQAMQLYFENGGAPLTEEPQPPSSGLPTGHEGSGHGHGDGTVHVDSDDDIAIDETRSTPRNQPPQASTFEDDAAMARRLQEEMYSGTADNSDGVRAPMARTTETLVGPDAGIDDDDMHASILGQLRARQSRRS